MRTQLIAAATVLALSIGCSAPAEDSSASASSEGALGASAGTTHVDYRGALDVDGNTFTIEVSVAHPRSITTTQTIRGSQIMSDSPVCDAYLESFRGNVTLRVRDASGSVVTQSSGSTYFNTQIDLDDSVCPQGLLTTRKPVGALGVETTLEGVAFQAGDKNVHVPFGYGTMGTLLLSGDASFEATGRSRYQGERESDRGSSKLETRGTARIHMAESVRVSVGLTFNDLKWVSLDRVQ